MNEEHKARMLCWYKFKIGHASSMAKLAVFDSKLPVDLEEQLALIWGALGQLRIMMYGDEGSVLLDRKAMEFDYSLRGIGEPLDRDKHAVLRLPFPIDYWPDDWVKLGVMVANWEYSPTSKGTDLLQEVWVRCVLPGRKKEDQWIVQQAKAVVRLRKKRIGRLATRVDSFIIRNPRL